MPVFKVIPVVLVLFLIRKEREREREKKKAIPVAIIRSHSESQKEPTKDPLHTDGTLQKENQGHGSQRNYQSAEMQRSTFFFLTKRVKYRYQSYKGKGGKDCKIITNI